jgi:hypothetical protein
MCIRDSYKGEKQQAHNPVNYYAIREVCKTQVQIEGQLIIAFSLLYAPLVGHPPSRR